VGLGGNFEGAAALTVYGGYAFTPNISTEVALSQVLGNFSDSTLFNANLLNQPFPRLHLSPFFTLGVGVIDTKPHTTLVQEENRTNMYAQVGIGVRQYVSRRFILRFEYKNYVIFSSDTNNEEVGEWKAGFAFFY
jgi:hypothetical protein